VVLSELAHIHLNYNELFGYFLILAVVGSRYHERNYEENLFHPDGFLARIDVKDIQIAYQVQKHHLQ
jgi:hypothetical protein